jgi:SAM-dependent methyltransferase
MSPLIKKLSVVSNPSESRLWYNDWVSRNAKGIVLDVGKSTYWDYGFPTVDTNKKLNPTYCQDICNSNLASEFYDTVLCNGMMEFVSSPQEMVNEVYRILKPGGKAIFGFVGKDYKPYKKDWKFYDEDVDFNVFSEVEIKDFGNNYHFIKCKK